MKLVSIVTPCFNEEANVDELCARIRKLAEAHPQYAFEHVFIDNASSDGTVARIKAAIARDPRVRLIVNVRNFGPVRSPYHGLLQAQGDAVVVMASDLQDPPELVTEFLAKWEQGFKIAIGIKATSQESWAMFAIRRAYYRLVARVSDVDQVTNFTGFGLYDQEVVAQLRALDEPYPYFRGLIAELGYARAELKYEQASRKRGITSHNFFSLYDIAMLGITSHSRAPLRLATMSGFFLSSMSALIAAAYLVAKLLFWNSIPFGFAPLLIGMFFLGSVQLFFIGIVGEYIGFMYLHVLKRPLVIEKERVNFERTRAFVPSATEEPS